MVALVVVVILIVFARAAFARRCDETSASVTDYPMPCPSCGYDVRANPDRCPECGAAVPSFRRPLDPRKLRDDWPLSPIVPRSPGLEESLVRVWDAPSSFAAQLLVDQFEQRGIRAVVSRNLAPMAVGNYVAPPANHAVAVWSRDVETANAILERFARLS